MAPSMTSETAPSHSPRQTVAMKKEALELRKVRIVLNHLTSALFIPNVYMFSYLCLWHVILTFCCYVLSFLDAEAFDGKEKARSHQRQPEPTEGLDSSSDGKRCKLQLRFEIMLSQQ